MKRSVGYVVAFALIFGLKAQAPVQLFRSAAEWKAGTPSATYPRLKGFGMTFGQPYLMVNDEPGGKIRNVSLKKAWGYATEGKLYRWDKKKPSRHLELMSEGRICVWKSKYAYFGSDNSSSDHLLFITVGVDGEIIPLPHGLRSPPQGRYNSFAREEREGPLAPLISCLEATDQLEPAKACIARFNGTEATKP